MFMGANFGFSRFVFRRSVMFFQLPKPQYSMDSRRALSKMVGKLIQCVWNRKIKKFGLNPEFGQNQKKIQTSKSKKTL